MDLSIIIVNYRGWSHLKKCLDALASYGQEKIMTEVIIVDNQSSDGKLDQFKSDYNEFIFISNKVNGGFSSGCNLGSRSASGNFLLFLNPDTVAPESEVEKLFEKAKSNPGNYISSCRQVNERGKESRAYGIFPGYGTLTGPGRAIYRILNKNKLRDKIEEINNVIYPDWVSGSVMMIDKEIFKTTGGFDEDYWMYSEDTDICRRARDKGGNIAYFTDITIQHNHGGSSRINLKTTSLTKTEVFISNHIYISKHASGIKKFLLQIWLVFYNLITGLFSALTGLIIFFKPKMLAKAHIYFRLISYYIGAVKRGTWISPRSVNF
jgi:GT2 family glycosyltransferase